MAGCGGGDNKIKCRVQQTCYGVVPDTLAPYKFITSPMRERLGGALFIGWGGVGPAKAHALYGTSAPKRPRDAHGRLADMQVDL